MMPPKPPSKNWSFVNEKERMENYVCVSLTTLLVQAAWTEQ